MADTQRTQAALLSLFADNTTGDISPQDARDMIVSKAHYDLSNLTVASQAQGDMLYYNGSNWVRLAAGTSGYLLKTLGAGANPAWQANDNTALAARTRSFWIPAGSNWIASTGSPDLAMRGSDAWYRKMAGWAFDAASQEAISTSFGMPADWDGGAITIKILWAPADGNAGNVQWDSVYGVIASGDQLDEAHSSGGAGAFAAPGVIDQVTLITLGTPTPAFSGAYDTIRFTLDRDAAAGGDTYGSDAWFLGMRIEYTADS